MNTAFQRAPLSSELQELKQRLAGLLPVLEAQPDWYASILFERRASRTYAANLKQTQISDQVNTGVVFRIYDGYTLYEQATDDLEADSLKRFVSEFAQRVKNTPAPTGAVKRPYRAVSWKDRLAAGPHESELTTQIPEQVAPDQWVHFGVRFQNDPRSMSDGQVLEMLKGLLERSKALAPGCGLKEEDLTFIGSRQGFSTEESIFIDREVRMSQTLYRMYRFLMTMSGADRTFTRKGGLGGLEMLDITDDDIREILRDLKGLKAAERLQPGRYKVLFGPALTGVLAHEAFGHSQEGDTCARGRSKAWELHKTGENVGNELATILNNPAIYDTAGQPYAAWGSYFFDEEGWLAQEQVILDQGKLSAPMTNLTSAIRLGVPRTANGKRESWANGVYTRQTNTYFSAGNQTLDELMGQIDYGFLALDCAGGMEDPKGMGIQVGIAYLQEVKNGKLTGRIFRGPAGGDIQMTGYTPEVLNSIIGKSKIEFNSIDPDKAKHPFNDVGGCGKYHKEFVNAGCGGPYVLLNQVILG